MTKSDEVAGPHQPAPGHAAPPDPSIKPKLVQRAAVEAMTRLRPQPSAAQVTQVLEFLAELDEHGNPKHKFKDGPAAGQAAVAKAKELLDGDKKAEDEARAARDKANQAEADEAAKKAASPPR